MMDLVDLEDRLLEEAWKLYLRLFPVRRGKREMGRRFVDACRKKQKARRRLRFA